jgi:hypothetical protein
MKDVGKCYGHLVYLLPFGIFCGYFSILCGHLVYFVVILVYFVVLLVYILWSFWYILWSFGILCSYFGIFCGHFSIIVPFWYNFHVLVCCSRKHLAALERKKNVLIRFRSEASTKTNVAFLRSAELKKI